MAEIIFMLYDRFTLVNSHIGKADQRPGTRDEEADIRFGLGIGIADGIQINDGHNHNHIADDAQHRNNAVLEDAEIFSFFEGDDGPHAGQAIEHEGSEVRGQRDAGESYYRPHADRRDD